MKCAICQDTARTTDFIKTTCFHNFHRLCLQKWLIFEEKKDCPVCRKEIVTDISVEEKEVQLRLAWYDLHLRKPGRGEVSYAASLITITVYPYSDKPYEVIEQEADAFVQTCMTSFKDELDDIINDMYNLSHTINSTDC